MKKTYLLSLLAFILVISSCKKNDTSTNDSSLEGTYTLKSLTAKTNSTITGDDGEKAVTTSDYSTTNNQGTIVFGKSSITATDFAYSVSTSARYFFYLDNELIDSTSYPFSFTLPATTSTSTYKLLGADSIYFSPGVFSSGIDMAGGSTQYGASGGRYTLAGNQLTITQNVAKDSTFMDSGVTFQMHQSVAGTIVLEKQ